MVVFMGENDCPLGGSQKKFGYANLFQPLFWLEFMWILGTYVGCEDDWEPSQGSVETPM